MRLCGRTNNPQVPGAYNNRDLLLTHCTRWLLLCSGVFFTPGCRLKEQPVYETRWFIAEPQESPKASAHSGASTISAHIPQARASHKAKLDGKWVVNIILLQAGQQIVGNNNIIYFHVIPHNAATRSLYPFKTPFYCYIWDCIWDLPLQHLCFHFKCIFSHNIKLCVSLNAFCYKISCADHVFIGHTRLQPLWVIITLRKQYFSSLAYTHSNASPSLSQNLPGTGRFLEAPSWYLSRLGFQSAERRAAFPATSKGRAVLFCAFHTIRDLRDFTLFKINSHLSLELWLKFLVAGTPLDRE